MYSFVFLDFVERAGGVEVFTQENISIKFSSQNISLVIDFKLDNSSIHILMKITQYSIIF